MREKVLFTKIFILVFLMLHINSFAQNSPIDKGSVIISGNFTFSSAGGELYEHPDGDRLTTIEFDPAANFFVGSGFAIGARLLFERVTYGDNYNRTTWGGGPEINYFFNISQEKSEAKGTTYPFLQAGFFYTNNYYHSFGDSEYNYIGTKIRIGAGIAHMISRSVAIAGLVAYDIEKEKGDRIAFFKTEDTESGNQYGIYAGLIIFLY